MKHSYILITYITLTVGIFCSFLCYCNKADPSSQFPGTQQNPDQIEKSVNNESVLADEQYSTPELVDDTTDDFSDLYVNDYLTFDDSTLTFPRLRQLLIKDSIITFDQMSVSFLNGKLMVNTYIEKVDGYVDIVGEGEKHLYTLSPSLIQSLLKFSELPEFKQMIRSIKSIEDAESDFISTLRSVIHSRELCKKAPELLDLLMADRLYKRKLNQESISESYDQQEQRYTSKEIIDELSRISVKFSNEIPPCIYPLMFWAECELDSVTDLSEKLVLKISSLLDSSTLSSDTTGLKSLEVKPMFFEPKSFIDPDVETNSHLDARDQLIELYFNDVVRAYLQDSVTTKDQHLYLKLLDIKSDYFHPNHTVFALFIDNNSGYWKQVSLDPSLRFTTDDYCTGKVLRVHLQLNNTDDQSAFVYSALPHEEVKKGKIPTGYHSPIILSIDSAQVNRELEGGYGTIHSVVTYCFSVPETEKRLKQLFRIDEFGTSQGAKVTMTSRIYAVMHSGDTVKIADDIVFGHHGPENV